MTAYALGNALGATTPEVVASLEAGRSGLKPAADRFGLPFETACGTFAGELPVLTGSLAPWDGRLGRMAVSILDELAAPIARALSRWGRDRVAVILGTSTGGIAATESAFDAFRRDGTLPAGFDLDRHHAFDSLVAVVRARTGIAGPGWIVSTACSSSGKVFGSAVRLVAAGLADAVLVGGVDTLCETTLRGFGSLEALARGPCRPFARDRDGTSIGEGGAFLLLEREGDGPARLLGVGESTDAHHMSHPHPEGRGARAAMEEALRCAGLPAAAVDHVNAHGTGTPANDGIEAAAVAAVVGTAVPVASTKGYTGHLLGAAAATEAIFSIVAIERGFVPASLGASPLDPAVTVDVVRERRAMPIRTVLSNSFAFGGNNVSLLFGGPA